jgi:uncharacterized membrane-anchored protein
LPDGPPQSDAEEYDLSRIILVTLLSALAGTTGPAITAATAAFVVLAGTAAVAASPDPGSPSAMLETVDQAYASALRQAIGAPARGDLAGEATVRLEQNQLLVPKEPAARLLTLTDRDIPTDFIGLLLGPEGMEAGGTIRYVPAGFVNADEALSWSSDDILASLNDTVESGNAARLKANIEPREARRWISPPRYNPETHQLTWAALVIPKTAPRGSDGATTYHAIGFGRDGYIELAVVTSVQKADEVGRFAAAFLGGLSFLPSKAYGDVQPADKRSPTGLAGAMGIDSLHKAESDTSFWTSDTMVPVVGSIVASIGALGLVIYVYRHMRRLRRRV